MTKILGLALVGGGLIWAHKEGYFDDLIANLGASSDRASAADPADTAHDPYDAGIIVRDDFGVATPQGEESAHVQMLRENEYVLSPWAAKNIYWTAAMCRTENYHMNPLTIGGAGEWGVMQVMPGTAADLSRNGYTKFEPTREVLQTVAGGLYFGTAYLDWVSKNPRAKGSRDWITRAYNGGPGWEHLGQEEKYSKSLSMTADYLRIVTSNFSKIKAGG